MTVTLNLPPNIEQAYIAQAQARGLPLEEVMAETLVAAQQTAEETPALSYEEWMRELTAMGQMNADKKFPILSNEDLRRENMYDDRGL
jgi:hypothetical protein